MTADEIEKGDLVKLTFDQHDEASMDHSPIKSKVLSVDTDPAGMGSELEIELHDEGSSSVYYTEGEHDGERFATVHRYSEFSGSFMLGKNAEIEVL